MRNKFSLKSIIRGTQNKFGDAFSEKLFLAQLAYFGDIKDFTIEFVDKKLLPKAIEKFLANQLKQCKKDVLF